MQNTQNRGHGNTEVRSSDKPFPNTRKKTITITYKTWKMLTQKKLDGKYNSLDDLIYQMFIKSEVSQ